MRSWRRLGVLALLALLVPAPAAATQPDDPAEPSSSPPMIAPNVAKARLLIDPTVDPYVPKMPKRLPPRPRWFLLHLCVSRKGAVVVAKVLRGEEPAANAAALAAVKRWRYQPYVINGETVPFCSVLRLEHAQAAAPPARRARSARWRRRP